MRIMMNIIVIIIVIIIIMITIRISYWVLAPGASCSRFEAFRIGV